MNSQLRVFFLLLFPSLSGDPRRLTITAMKEGRLIKMRELIVSHVLLCQGIKSSTGENGKVKGINRTTPLVIQLKGMERRKMIN